MSYTTDIIKLIENLKVQGGIATQVYVAYDVWEILLKESKETVQYNSSEKLEGLEGLEIWGVPIRKTFYLPVGTILVSPNVLDDLK